MSSLVSPIVVFLVYSACIYNKSAVMSWTSFAIAVYLLVLALVYELRKPTPVTTP